MSGGCTPVRKGFRVKRELVDLLCEVGLPCRRVPFSGTIGGNYSGDVDLELHDRIAKIQVKTRRQFRTLHQWLGSHELLILKADRCDPLVVMSIRLFGELATAARRRRP